MFLTELRRELRKLFYKERCILISLVVLIIVTLLAILQYRPVPENWRDSIAKEIQENNAAVRELTQMFGKDQEVEAIFANENKLLRYRLEHNISPAKSVFEYLSDNMSTYFVLMVIISICIAASVLGVEYKNGTIFHLAAREVKLQTVILAKICAFLIFVFVLVLYLLAAAFLSAGIIMHKNGFSVMAIVVNDTGNMTFVNSARVIAESLLVMLPALLFFGMLSMLLSALLKSKGYANVLAILIYFFEPMILNNLDVPAAISSWIVFNSADTLINAIGTSVKWTSKTIQTALLCVFLNTLLLAVIVSTYFCRKPFPGKK